MGIKIRAYSQFYRHILMYTIALVVPFVFKKVKNRPLYFLFSSGMNPGLVRGYFRSVWIKIKI